MRRVSFVSLLLLTCLLLSACASTNKSDDPAEQYKNYSSEQLFNMGEKALAKRRYTKSVKYFEALESLYPFGSQSERALRDNIYAYYKTQDYASSEAAADRYIRLYPQGEYTDYAYYIKGLSVLEQDHTFLQKIFSIDFAERDLTDAKQAFFDFRDLAQLFPQSKYAADARQRMVYLRNLFAKQEMEIANYYYKRKVYLAAANRASYVIQHYEGTPQVEQALVLLVKADRALGLDKSANDSLRVLQTNYPNSKFLARLQDKKALS